jgi:hypothetical protein
MEHNVLRDDAPVAVELRPGVSFPDWSMVTTDIAHDTLAAIMDAIGFEGQWADYDAGEDVARRAVLDLYGREGRAPTKAALAADTGMEAAAVSDALARLRARDFVVLDADTGEITGAYPFTDRDTGHRVRLVGRVLNAMCAVDALGAGAMYGHDVAIDSSCRHCAAPVRLTTRDNGAALDDISPSQTVVWTGISYQGQAATSLCTVIAFFCSAEHLAAWRDENAESTGFELSPGEAMEVGKAIFAPLLAPAVAHRT